MGGTTISLFLLSKTVNWKYGPCLYIPRFKSLCKRKRFSSRAYSKICNSFVLCFPFRNKYQHRQILCILVFMEVPIIQKTYEVYKGVVDINNHLEKRWRYSLGHSLEESVLSLLDSLIMAKHAPKTLKAPYLLKSMSHLEISRLKLRLVLEFKAVKNETNVFKMQLHNEEIGKMLGGWIRS